MTERAQETTVIAVVQLGESRMSAVWAAFGAIGPTAVWFRSAWRSCGQKAAREGSVVLESGGNGPNEGVDAASAQSLLSTSVVAAKRSFCSGCA
jgi:hypothetical protein